MDQNLKLNLKHLVNLALNSPEIGVLNLNLLKKFLVELLKALKLEDFELQLNANETSDDFSRDLLSIKYTNNDTDRLRRLMDTAKPMNERVFDIEDKLNRFQRQFDAFDSLPNNHDLIERSKESSSNMAGGKQMPLLEVWQYTQLSKRVELIEAGLTKLTSLVHDLIQDMNSNNELFNKNKASLDEIMKILDKNKEAFLKIDQLPSPNHFSNLEHDLSSLKANKEHTKELDSKIFELNEALRNLEKKLEDHKTLSKSLDNKKCEIDELKIENNEINNNLKLLRDQVSSVSKSRDEIDRLKDEFCKLSQLIDDLKGNLNKIDQTTHDESKSVDAFNNEIDQLKQALQECMNSNKTNKSDMSLLNEANRLLEQAKIDRDWLSKELDRKANRDEMSGLNDIQEKTYQLEEAYKRDHDEILRHLQSKLDRLEFKDFKDPLKDYIAKQLNKIKKLHETQQVGYETNAAGMKRPYIYFKCLSCDKPINAYPKPAFPSIPLFEKLKSMQRSSTAFDRTRAYDTDRPCGGAHTITTSLRKIRAIQVRAHDVDDATRLPTLISSFRSELTGNDGKIYKGDL